MSDDSKVPSAREAAEAEMADWPTSTQPLLRLGVRDKIQHAIERDRAATIEACALRVDDALCEDMKCRHAVCIYLREAAARIRALDTRKGERNR